MQDWSGNKKAVFVTNGDSSHSQQARADWDYYATDPRAVAALIKRERFSPEIQMKRAKQLYYALTVGFSIGYKDCKRFYLVP